LCGCLRSTAFASSTYKVAKTRPPWARRICDEAFKRHIVTQVATWSGFAYCAFVIDVPDASLASRQPTMRPYSNSSSWIYDSRTSIPC
jgi:hypothetical protein